MSAFSIRRREFLALAGAGLVGAALRGQGQTGSASRAGFLLSTAGCGRATGYAEASKIVTVGDRTHVAWLDADARGFWVRVRTLDWRSGAWSPTVTVGAAQDNHGGPGLTVDRKGYLHIVYYPHHEPFRYRRSTRPNDASAWEPEISFGERLSYPVLLCTPDDTVLLTARRSFLARDGATKDRPWELELWEKPAAGRWRRRGPLLRSRHSGYTHFQESLAWGADRRTIHLSCRVYETTGRAGETPLQTVGYLKSPDAGKSWQRADGTRVETPTTADAIDIVAQGGGATGRTLYAGALASDPRGVPHLLHSRREKDGRARTFLVTPVTGGGWTKRDLHAFLPERWREWDLVLPGAMTFNASGRATIVATLANAPAGDDWAHATNEVVRFWSNDGARTFSCEVLSGAADKPVRWLPSLERPTGHHAIPDEPGILFQAGSGGAGLSELELNNEVWWRPTSRSGL